VADPPHTREDPLCDGQLPAHVSTPGVASVFRTGIAEELSGARRRAIDLLKAEG
jgi:hypothetical protein